MREMPPGLKGIVDHVGDQGAAAHDMGKRQMDVGVLMRSTSGGVCC